MNKRTTVFGVLYMCISLIGIAQQQVDSTAVEQLSEIVVTDSRFNLKRENSGKTVIKISKQDIERHQGKTVSELINTKSGIEINGSRSVEGQNLGYFVRGGNNRQVLVLIDGVQVNDPSLVANEFDLRLMDLNSVESIEIIKGAASTLYGNAAATAVINITSKKPSNETISGQFLTVVGTNQSQDNLKNNVSSFSNNVTVSGTINKFNYLASFGNRFVDGLSAAQSDTPEIDPFSRYHTNIRMGYDFNSGFSVKGFLSYDDLKTDIDGYPAPTYTFSDTDDRYYAKQKRVGLSPQYVYEKGSFHINAAFTDIDRETVSDFSSYHKAKSYIVDSYNKYIFNKTFYTIVGLNYGHYNSVFSEEESFTNADPYLNVVYISGHGLNFNMGVRLNNHSEYGSHFVYSVNPSYSVTLNQGYIKAFGSYATSFIAPNLSQLYGFFGANPDLDPEENATLEGGLEYNTKRGFKLSGVYFNRTEKNTIIYTTGYENADTVAEVRGVEIEGQFDVLEELDLTANYTFTELKNGIRLRVPKHKINTGIGYSFSERTYVSLQYQFVGDRVDVGDVKLKSFSLVDLYVSQRILNNKVKLFTNVTNLLNEDYFEIFGFTTRGRNINFGLQINL
ncbi:TonB-dependent receptor plug domain-containing protein [Aestuariivivens sediminicola]|uniref:TonB-dependent receptor plug domain-containing protein n=1 Tax=Aestuariivivens sediminicola TaxID=2913560 RepID=UPI001F567A0D|nr:TonB-dependent receptor [Aestuariivivens sediminicola]